MSGRRINDFYPTPAWGTERLLARCLIDGVVLEPCAGDGRIANVLKNSSARKVYTNDIDAKYGCCGAIDALHPHLWDAGFWSSLVGQLPDWVISNPPFSIADRLVPLAFQHAQSGVAMLLRISWLEPTKARAEFLAAHPPTMLIVLPRISFTGDGKSDNVTCAWFVWDKQHQGNLCQQVHQEIIIEPHRAPQPALAEAAP